MLKAVAESLPPTDFRYIGDSLLSGETYIRQLRRHLPADATIVGEAESGRWVLQNAQPGKTSRYVVSLPVQKNKEYLLRLPVKSDRPVVVRIGALSMSYNALGQWQTVTGLYRVPDATLAEITLEIHPLLPQQENGAVELGALSFIEVERPTQVRRKRFSGESDLVSDDRPAATIIFPQGEERYAAMAAAIQSAIREKTGVELPVVGDREATLPDAPVLRDPYRTRHLILLGRLGNNRALWAAYNRFLTAVDGYYPGGDGYVLQSAANVFHNGANHLILGGTSDTGAGRAVERFLEVLKTTPWKEGRLRVPWLLESDLQGECLAFFKAENEKWERNDDLLPKPEPGYGNVARWYQNTMAYYWSGLPEFKKRSESYLRQVLEERAQTHHYISEFMTRTWGMIDESGWPTPEQCDAFAALLTSNFLDMLTVTDLNWMTTFAPPYGQIGMVNRHQIAPWISDYKLAEYLDEHLETEGGLRDLIRFRRAEKERAFDDFVIHRNAPSLPGGVADEAYAEGISTFYRYALEKERYGSFFASGQAHKALLLERLNPLTGRMAFPPGNRDSRLVLGIMASLTGDPNYQWLWKHLPEHVHIRGYFQGRYLGQVRRYTPDASLPEKEPTQWSGVQVAPNPVDNAPVRSNERDYYFLSYRTGFKKTDDFLAFNGHEWTAPAGIITQMTSRGVMWLGGSGEGVGRLNQNTAAAIRTDAAAKNEAFDPTSRTLWLGNAGKISAVAFDQLLRHDLRWRRDFVALREGLFLFRDHFTALEEGTYSLTLTWNPAGAATIEGSTATFITRDAALRLSTPDGGALVADEEGFLRTRLFTRLKKGESRVVHTVVESSSRHDHPWLAARRVGEALLLGDEAELLWGTPEGAPFQSDAPLAVRSGKEKAFFHLSRLSVGSTDIVEAKPGILAFPQAQERLSKEAMTRLDHGWEQMRERLATLPPVAAATPDATLAGPTAVEEEWPIAWHYRGMLRAERRESWRLREDGIVDLGETLPLVELRGHGGGSPLFVQGKLPEKIEVSTDGTTWQPLEGERRWRPGIRTANYGEAHPEPQTDEALHCPPTPARYLRLTPPPTQPSAVPLLFTGEPTIARHPLRLEVGDFLGTGGQQMLVVSDVFPQFPRAVREDDLSIALLDEKGEPLWRLDPAGPIQSVRLLEREAGKGKELFLLYANGTLEIYGLDGKPRASADLYALHREFHERHGRGNTRQPAGGFVLPFSVGLWRPNEQRVSKIVIGRYGGFSFLDQELKLEGVLAVSGYATPGMLEHGIDFGRGVEEQVVAERLRFWHLGGNEKPTVRDPGSHRFWPEVYQHLKTVKEDETSKVPLAGLPIRRFEPLETPAQKARHLLLVRGNTVSVYDGKTQTSAASWNSVAPITAAAILSRQPLHLLVGTRDGLLWELKWEKGLQAPPSSGARQAGDLPLSLRESAEGAVVMAGPHGLWLLEGETTRRIAEGNFRTARPVEKEGKITGILAAKQDGEVVLLKRP